MHSIKISYFFVSVTFSVSFFFGLRREKGKEREMWRMKVICDEIGEWKPTIKWFKHDASPSLSILRHYFGKIIFQSPFGGGGGQKCVVN